MFYPTFFRKDASYLSDFDLHKRQKAHTKTRKDNAKSRPDLYRLYDMLRHNFPEQAF